jgi:hypothetical protein
MPTVLAKFFTTYQTTFFCQPISPNDPALIKFFKLPVALCDDQINEQDEQVAHPAMVSTPQKTTHSGQLVIRHGQA